MSKSERFFSPTTHLPSATIWFTHLDTYISFILTRTFTSTLCHMYKYSKTYYTRISSSQKLNHLHQPPFYTLTEFDYIQNITKRVSLDGFLYFPYFHIIFTVTNIAVFLKTLFKTFLRSLKIVKFYPQRDKHTLIQRYNVE